jgi:WXXGXW repeat (2 copies)
MRAPRSLISLCLAGAALSAPSLSFAQIAVGVSITVAPPPLPVYVQPAIPAPGYIWTPGYWAYGPDGYYWVPGTWVEPPAVGLLWTPGYWGWRDGIYVWNAGYWGPHVGYYGGINYGFGYVGVGYAGGYWNGGVFSYNRTVNNFGGVTVVNTYNKTVINNTTVNQVSFNGPGGASAQPTSQELAAAKEKHVEPTQLQTQHMQAASTNRSLLASVNKGNPAIAATSKPGAFTGPGVVGAKAVTATGNPANLKGATGPGDHRTDLKGATAPGNPPADVNGATGPGDHRADLKGATAPGNHTVTTDSIKGPNSPTPGTPGKPGPLGRPNPNPQQPRLSNVAGPPHGLSPGGPHPGGPPKPPPPKKPAGKP